MQFAGIPVLIANTTLTLIRCYTVITVYRNSSNMKGINKTKRKNVNVLLLFHVKQVKQIQRTNSILNAK